ncbi:MAG: hypothetical protein ABFS86_12455 [Planctomycetota bacterium]
MRAGTLIALLLLVVGAILFAPRAGREEPAAPVPAAAPAPPGDEPPPEPIHDLRHLLDAIPADELSETWPNDVWRKLDSLRAEGRKSATTAEYIRVATWLENAREHARRLREEPRYLDAWKVRTNFRLHPHLGNYPFVVVSRPPWLVFVQKGEGAAAEADRAARWLGTLTEVIEERLAKPCGMPPFADLPRASERVLTMVIFKNQKTFREHFRWTGRPVGPWDDGWYETKLEGCFSFLRPDEDPDKWACRLLLPAAFQAIEVLIHHGIEREGRQGEDVGWDAKGMRGQLLWFRQGLMRMLSAAKVAEDGSVELFSIRPGHLRIIRETEERLDFGTLLKVSTTSDLRRKAFDVGLVELDALARSWALAHFLWHHEGGKYRGKLLEYLKGEFRGNTGYRYWKKVWPPADEDWTLLEKEFEAWLDATCEREGVK